MKQADYLIVLSTETAEGKEITKGDIIKRHTGPTSKGGFGWRRPGIDYLVSPDGQLQTIIPEQSPNEVDLWGISQGQKPINGVVKYLAYAGGKVKAKDSQKQSDSDTPEDKVVLEDKDTRTDAQKDTLAAVVKFYVKKFPQIQVLGFNQVPAKEKETNPAFDVAEWLEEIEIPEKNIFKGV